jgi:hypothetical protein
LRLELLMASEIRPDRRAFLKGSTAAAAVVVTGAVLAEGVNAGKLPAMPNNPRTQDAIPTRNLGKTGYKVGIFSLGGQAALEKPNNAGCSSASTITMRRVKRQSSELSVFGGAGYGVSTRLAPG